MPTYTYECQNCNYRFDVLQKISEKPKKICPQCNSPSLKRLISGGIGIIFKGSGFYITDYKRKNGNNGSDNISSSQQKKSNNKKKDIKKSA